MRWRTQERRQVSTRPQLASALLQAIIAMWSPIRQRNQIEHHWSRDILACLDCYAQKENSAGSASSTRRGSQMKYIR